MNGERGGGSGRTKIGVHWGLEVLLKRDGGMKTKKRAGEMKGGENRASKEKTEKISGHSSFTIVNSKKSQLREGRALNKSSDSSGGKPFSS